MHPNDPPRQPEAWQPDAFPPPPCPVTRLGAGECGDAIWECAAHPGGTVDGADRAVDATPPQPGGREASVRAGQLIDLVERRRPREQQLNS